MIWVGRGNQFTVMGIPGVRVVDDLPRLVTGPALFMTLNINVEGNATIGSGRLDGNGIPPDFLADIHIRRGFAHLFDREAFITNALRGSGRRKLPMYTSAWGADYADPDDFVTPFLSSKGTFAQIQGYKNLEADRLIEAAAEETNQGKRRRIYFRLQEVAFADVPAIYIVYPTDFVTMRSWVKGWYSNPAFPTVFGYFYTMSKSKN